jgi:hypothetical protein
MRWFEEYPVSFLLFSDGNIALSLLHLKTCPKKALQLLKK